MTTRMFGTALTRLTLIGALVASASCDMGGTFSPMSERMRLYAARDKWIATAPTTYSYTWQVVCFCPESQMRVTVVNGVVTDVRPVGGGEPLSNAGGGFFRPITEIFGFVLDGIDRDPYWMRAQYDPAFGFPADVFFDRERDIADEEWGFRVSDVTFP